MREKKIFVRTEVSAYQVIPEKLENRIMGTIAFLDTHVCVNNPYWESNGIITFLCKYYIVIYWW